MSYSVTCPSCGTSFPVDPAKVPEEGVLAQCSICPEVFEVTRPSAEEAAESAATDEVALEAPAVEVEAPAAEVEAPEVLPEPDIESEPDVAEAPTDPDEFVFETADASMGVDVASPPTDAVEEHTDDFGACEISFDEPIAVDEPAVEVEEEPAPEVEEPGFDAPLETAEPAGEAVPPEVEAPAAAPAAPIQFGKRDPSDKAKSLARSLVSDIIAYHKEKHAQALAAGTLVQDFEEEIEKSWKEYTEQVDDDVLANNTFFNDALNEILAEGDSVFTLEG